jgi:5-methylcytosine-specific restriction endonuclease McrA
MSQTKHKQCLVLNADYTPLSIIDYRKAISFLYKDDLSQTLEIVNYYKDDYLIGIDYKVYIPAVIRVKHYLNLHNCIVKFSRANLFVRDNYKCQYCGQTSDKNQMTYDHIIPKSQWSYDYSPTTWTNIVLACTECNRRKGNRTPEQANMKLMNIPTSPSKHKKYLSVTRRLDIIKNDLPEEWINYIF